MSFREIFVTLIIFCGTFFSAARILASDWQRVSYMPKVEHYRAAEQATECSVYRSVKEQSEQKISYNRKVLGESMRALELARRDLDACASSKGVSSTGGEKEVLIAELCPGLYESWLRPSYKVRMVAQDLREAYQTARSMKTQISRFCGEIPQAEVEEQSADAELAGDRQAELIGESQPAVDLGPLPADGRDIDDELHPDDGYEFVEIAKRELGGF